MRRDANIVWRTRLSSRVLGTAVLVAVFAGIAIDAVFVSASEPLCRGLLVLLLPLPLVWLFAFRPRLALEGEEVVIRNPLRSWRVPAADIESVWPGYSGIELRRRDGSKITAWAVQKSNLAHASRRRTRADGVAEQVTTFVAEHK